MDFERNDMKYEDYELEHFLVDEFFIQWVKNPNENTTHFWEKWLVANPKKRGIVLEAAQLIKSIGYKEKPEFSNEVYIKLFENIIRFEDLTVDQDTGIPKLANWYSFFSFRKIAAIFICAFCIWGAWDILSFQDEVEVKEVTFITKKNPKGVKSSIKLSDGSVIHLNSNSEIIYPNEFSDSLRTISLKGEAFFDVSKESRPFKVNVDNTIVEVLGTEFNINQSKGEELAVALVSGKVKVNDTHGNQVILDPSEMLVIKNDGNFYKSTFDSLQVVGWKDKNLIFKRDDFYTVKEKLENWYGIEITVKGKIGSKWAYTGEYHDETLKNVLEGIRQTSNIHYKLKGKKVEITL